MNKIVNKLVILLLIAVGWIFLGLNDPPPVVLQLKETEILVNGKPSKVYEIVQEDGTKGLTLAKGDRFLVTVDNQLPVPTSIHWHGIILPNNQDGVAYVTQPPIEPGKKYPYDYKLVQSGTYWMHSHYGLQEQKLLAAPLIIYDSDRKAGDVLDVVLFLEDFSFRSPEAIFKELRSGDSKEASMGSMGPMKPDLNDVSYDAYLANLKTLSDPDVTTVKPDQKVRLRVINGSSSSNFFIDLGLLRGEAIALDGEEIQPFEGSVFQLATAQRIDIVFTIPSQGNAFPIIAQGEGTTLRGGLVLATSGSNILTFEERAQTPGGALNYNQERISHAKTPLAKKEPDRKIILNLDGDMSKYIWMLDGKEWPYTDPVMVKEGERVELTFKNNTMMSHPMHLHGHFFQIVAINGENLNGALHDTVLVLPKSTVTVQFDADNPGLWPLHCHNLYHQYAGMETTLNYEGYPIPSFYRKSEK